VLGAVKVPDLVDLTVQAERSGFFDAVWAGDSLLAKPRLESVTLLSALAGVTSKLRLGVGCMATFVHRHPVMLAHQWASLDVLSGGRTLLAVCLGGPSEANRAQAAEHSVMSILRPSASDAWKKASTCYARSSAARTSRTGAGSTPSRA